MPKNEGKDKKKNTESTKGSHEELVEMKESVDGKQTDTSEKDNQVTEDEKSLNDKQPEVEVVTPEEQIAEWNDKYLRLYSEFDNYRKRTLKEKIELSKTASAEVIIKLLPVLDDFERAIKAFETNTDSTQAIKDGILLIFNKFITILNQQGLEQMKTIGETFDTDFHEAITNIPSPSPDKKNKILDEVEKGYLLNGKVIRYAKVVVGN